MMTRPLRIGIVGLGGIARERHVPGLRAIDGVEILAVANRTIASGGAAAAALGIPRAHRTWRALVGDDELDAVVVATWPSTHAPIAIAALEAGRHVLVEGRMATDARAAARMVAAARRHPDLVAMLVPGPLTGWADATVRRLLREDRLGALVRIHATWPSAGDGPDVEAFRLRQRDSGRNVLALGIVAESIARWVGQPTAVTARMRLLRRERTTPGGPVLADLPDDVVVLAEHDGDVLAILELSSEATAGMAGTFRLDGRRASLVLDIAARTLTLIEPGGRTTAVEPRPGEPRPWRVEADFVAAIRGEAPPGPNDWPTGLAGMRFTDAVHRSARTGRRVTLG